MSNLAVNKFINAAGFPVETKNKAYKSVASFTRPNDSIAYSSGDVISDSTTEPTAITFLNAGPDNGHVFVDTMEMYCNSAAVPSGAPGFRLHLYSETPTPINDNTAYTLASGSRASYQGYIDISGFQDLGDTIFTTATGLKTHVAVASGETSIYGILEIRGNCPSAANAVLTLTLKTVEA